MTLKVKLELAIDMILSERANGTVYGMTMEEEDVQREEIMKWLDKEAKRRADK